MEIRIMLLLFLFSPRAVNAQWEEQRKYKCDDFNYLHENLLSNPVYSDFKFFHHSDYEYRDIYLDTPDGDLIKNGFSLRFRKRIISADSSEYLLQLKSEMTENNPIRMEIEEPELDFYRIYHSDTTKLLIRELDLLFTVFDSSGIYSENSGAALANVKMWIAQKSEGVIAPFQKLNHLINEKQLKMDLSKLEPVLFGREFRSRFHVYYENDDSLSAPLFLPNVMKENETPVYFLKNENKIWLMEASMDNARFYSLTSNENYSIYELEVENKYYYTEKGSESILKLEKELMARFKIQTELNSKYRQCILR